MEQNKKSNFRLQIWSNSKIARVVYNEGVNFYIVELDKRISIVTDKNDEAIRTINDLKIDITNLLNPLNENRDKIEEIQLKIDGTVKFVKDLLECNLRKMI